MNSYDDFLGEILDYDLENVVHIKKMIAENHEMVEKVQLERNLVMNEESNADEVWQLINQQKRSYAINQRTGEKIVAGPNSYFYGTSLDDDGATPFYGTDKTYPGDTFPEFEENLTLAIEGKPAHTNGQ